MDYGQATDPERAEESAHCAGTLIVMAKTGRWSVAARLAMELDLFDPDGLDLEAPVYDTFEAFVTGVHAYGFFVELDRFFVEGPRPPSRRPSPRMKSRNFSTFSASGPSWAR